MLVSLSKNECKDASDHGSEGVAMLLLPLVVAGEAWLSESISGCP
jgi:hypothetical protein